MFPFSLVRSPELNLNLLRVLACVASVEKGSELRQLVLQAIEFAQYSFTVPNKVVVAENLGSVLQLHLKDIENVYGWQRCINNSSRRIQHEIRTVPNYKSPPRLAGFVKFQKKAKKLIELFSISYPHAVKNLGSITSRCSGNEPALLGENRAY